MYATRRKIVLPNGVSLETPLLVPSFSSRGIPDIKDVIKKVEASVNGPILFSAYDYHYKFIQRRISFAKTLNIIDSGGYECGTINDVVSDDKFQNSSEKWTKKLYELTVEKILLADNFPKVIVNFDHHGERNSIIQQINDAKESFGKFRKTGRKFLTTLLIKPETKRRQYINTGNVIKNIKLLKDFDIIGITEKELGTNLHERIKNLMVIRMALDEKYENKYIHVFGSLDSITTPLYFLAGADIFDGLTWLRYSYFKGITVYQQDYWALEHPSNGSDNFLRLCSFMDNFQYLAKMDIQMKMFAKSKNFKVFNTQGDFLKKGDLIKRLWEEASSK